MEMIFHAMAIVVAVYLVLAWVAPRILARFILALDDTRERVFRAVTDIEDERQRRAERERLHHLLSMDEDEVRSKPGLENVILAGQIRIAKMSHGARCDSSSS